MSARIGLFLLVSVLIARAFALPALKSKSDRCNTTLKWDEMECVGDTYKHGTIPEMLKSIRYLDFKSCFSVENGSKKPFQNLKSVKIECNQSEVEEVPLNRLKELRTLHVSGNVTSFPRNFFCAFNLGNLDLSNNRLSAEEDFGLLTNCSTREEPGTCGNDITILELSNNKLESITKNGFLCNLGQLYYLNLTENEISSIEVGSFDALKKLEHLHLTNNRLSKLPRGLFRSVEYLKRLNLSGNHFITLEPNAFKEHFFLGNLDLSRNRLIGTIESSIFAGLSALHKLNLEWNFLTHISSDAFSECPRLEFLYLAHNRLKQIPSLLPHPTLVWLFVDHNEIEEVTESGISSTLLVLGLSFNKLGPVLGSKIFQNYFNLDNLDLSGNRIETLHDDTFYFNLTKLEEKYSWKSGSTVTLFGRNLRFEDKTYNKSDSSSRATKFRKLINVIKLSHNRITEFKYSWLPKDSNAVFLDHNQIRQLPKFDSDDISELSQIILSGNLIESVSRGQLPPHVTRLYLDSNKIRNVEAGTFENLKQLEILYLQNNSLTTVAGIELNNSTKLIKIRDNSLSCDCKTAGALRNYVLKHEKLIDKPNELLCKPESSSKSRIPVASIDVTRCFDKNVKPEVTWWQIFRDRLLKILFN